MAKKTAPKVTGSALWYDKAMHMKTEMNCYSNDVYEYVPFTLSDADAKLDPIALKNKIGSAVYKRFKPSHFGGCGYSCSVSGMEWEPGSKTGYAILMHYHGIGD